MLTVRFASPAGQRPPPLAVAARRAIEQRTLPLDGTVLISTGDPRAVRPTDIGPRIVVPLALEAEPSALGWAQVELADAVVVVHRDEAQLLPGHINPGTPVIVISHRPGHPLLDGANPSENIQALTALAEYGALASHIPALQPPAAALIDLAECLADAVTEAVLVTSTTT